MPKNYTQIDFINNANIVHNYVYDYSLVNYINMKTPVIIICKIHGEFEQRPDVHLQKNGCKQCNTINNLKKIQEQIIIDANIVHNYKYDYSLVKYNGSQIKIKIICPIHGEFEQTPSNHINHKRGCSKCNGGISYTNDIFISMSNIKHLIKYDYSLVNYINAYTNVKIICKEHGEFEQTPSAHLYGQGCKLCAIEKTKKTHNEYLIEANNKFGNYKYLNIYSGIKSKMIIYCDKHGEFEQRADSHLSGKGCPKCVNENKAFTKEQFVESAKNIHGEKNNYDNSNYINMKTPILIDCIIHGEYKQLPKDHINNKCGCPKCNTSKGENEIEQYLLKNNIDYIREKRFSDCKSKTQLPFDFYLNNLNTCIEFDGRQHFTEVEMWGGEKGLIERQLRDKIKTDYCKDNNIKLIRIKYSDIIIEQLKNNL